jgi:hypothetical protein
VSSRNAVQLTGVLQENQAKVSAQLGIYLQLGGRKRKRRTGRRPNLKKEEKPTAKGRKKTSREKKELQTASFLPL